MYEHVMQQRATYLLAKGAIPTVVVSYIAREYGMAPSQAEAVVEQARQAIVRHAMGALSHADTMRYRQ